MSLGKKENIVSFFGITLHYCARVCMDNVQEAAQG